MSNLITSQGQSETINASSIEKEIQYRLATRGGDYWDIEWEVRQQLNS